METLGAAQIYSNIFWCNHVRKEKRYKKAAHTFPRMLYSAPNSLKSRLSALILTFFKSFGYLMKILVILGTVFETMAFQNQNLLRFTAFISFKW